MNYPWQPMRLNRATGKTEFRSNYIVKELYELVTADWIEDVVKMEDPGASPDEYAQFLTLLGVEVDDFVDDTIAVTAEHRGRARYLHECLIGASPSEPEPDGPPVSIVGVFADKRPVACSIADVGTYTVGHRGVTEMVWTNFNPQREMWLRITYDDGGFFDANPRHLAYVRYE